MRSDSSEQPINSCNVWLHGKWTPRFLHRKCFSACFSPPNYDQGAKGRQQQVGFLWELGPEQTLERASKHTTRMVLEMPSTPECFGITDRGNHQLSLCK
jgi:hypothetical protein